MSTKDSVATFDFNSATKRATEYQAKLIEISKANIDPLMQYAEAIARVRSPTEFFSITSEFAKKRMDVFQENTKQLMDLAKL